MKKDILRSRSTSNPDIVLPLEKIKREDKHVSPRNLNAIFIDSDMIKRLMNREYILSPRTRESLLKN